MFKNFTQEVNHHLFEKKLALKIGAKNNDQTFLFIIFLLSKLCTI